MGPEGPGLVLKALMAHTQHTEPCWVPTEAQHAFRRPTFTSSNVLLPYVA